MSVPSRSQSAAILLSLEPPEWHLRHSRAVAEVAGWLALRAERAGARLDRALVESAALLHDVDKLATAKAELDGVRHGEGSALWLARRGHPELGPAVEGHPVTRLENGAWFDEWLGSAGLEALIVSYSDKRAGQRLESMTERFESWERRYPPEERARKSRGGWTLETLVAVRGRCARLERRVCAIARVRPEDVRRLPWTARAIGLARISTRDGAAR